MVAKAAWLALILPAANSCSVQLIFQGIAHILRRRALWIRFSFRFVSFRLYSSLLSTSDRVLFFFIVALFLFVVLCIDTVVSSNCLYICRPFYCTDRARAALYSLTNKVSEFDHWKSITTKQVFNQVYWMIAYHCASNLNIICIICLLRTLIARLTILTRFITLVLFALKITFCTLYQTNNFY